MFICNKCGYVFQFADTVKEPLDDDFNGQRSFIGYQVCPECRSSDIEEANFCDCGTVKKKADEDVDGGYTYTDNDKTKSVKSQILSQAGMKYGSSMTMDKNGNWVDNNKKKRDAYIDSEIRKMWQNNELSDNEALSLLKDFGID